MLAGSEEALTGSTGPSARHVNPAIMGSPVAPITRGVLVAERMINRRMKGALSPSITPSSRALRDTNPRAVRG
jgi:hypothetical protein